MLAFLAAAGAAGAGAAGGAAGRGASWTSRRGAESCGGQDRTYPSHCKHLLSFLGPYINRRGAARSPAAQGSRRTREAAQRGATLSPRRSRQAVSESVKTGRVRVDQKPYPSRSKAVSESVKTGRMRVSQDRPYPSRSRGGSACHWSSLAEYRKGLPGRAGRARLVRCITGLRGRRSRIRHNGGMAHPACSRGAVVSRPLAARYTTYPCLRERYKTEVAPWVPDRRIPVRICDIRPKSRLGCPIGPSMPRECIHIGEFDCCGSVHDR